MDFINGTMKMHLMKVLLEDLLFKHILNTIKEGGETEFLYQNKRIKAVQGTVIDLTSWIYSRSSR